MRPRTKSPRAPAISTRAHALRALAAVTAAERKRRLDRELGRIERAQLDAAAATYELAAALATIAREKLFRARGYASFPQFLEAEGPVRRSQAYKLLAVAEMLNRAELLELGVERAYAEAIARRDAARTPRTRKRRK